MVAISLDLYGLNIFPFPQPQEALHEILLQFGLVAFKKMFEIVILSESWV